MLSAPRVSMDTRGTGLALQTVTAPCSRMIFFWMAYCTSCALLWMSSLRIRLNLCASTVLTLRSNPVAISFDGLALRQHLEDLALAFGQRAEARLAHGLLPCTRKPSTRRVSNAG